ncbi:hypothetical protein AAHH17_08255 [Lysinibacillus capsici]|uniref:hypothetical protein n=1 Tax=Lysinibacillus capsici TaxID=2115968 RepID=UPI0032E3EDBA
MLSEYKVNLYFSESESETIFVKAENLEKAIFDVSKMIEDKKVVVKPEGHYAKGYNMGLVKTYHISAK